MEPDLKPAVYEESEVKEFAAQFPWKWVALFVGTVVFFGGGYLYRQDQKIADLRQSIATSYSTQVSGAAGHINTFREKLEDWAIEVAGDEPETWADERLNLAGLHNASGVYLRVHADQAGSRPALAEAARGMSPDAIPRCLGLSPTSLRAVYELGDFLEPSWAARLQEAPSVMALRVIEDELRRHIESDLPMIASMTSADYFLLALVHGNSRSAHPVDIYLWDLRSDRLLLKTRTQARGRLVQARIALEGTPRTGYVESSSRSGASDCSIASQVRAAAGRGLVEFESQQGSLLQDNGSPTPEGEAGEAGEEGEAGEAGEVEGDAPAASEAAAAADPATNEEDSE